MTAPAKHEPGKRYGLWTLVEPAGFTARREQRWRVRCECGTTAVKVLSKVTSGQSRSCGCTRQARHQEALQHLSSRGGV